VSWMRVLASRVAGLFRRDRLDDEVGFHVDMQTEDNVRAGMSPEQARLAALRSFGGIGAMTENYRDRTGFVFVETVLKDVRYTMRSLGRSPVFALTATATLAVAIAANTVTFSVLDAVVLRPLPFPSPEQLTISQCCGPATDAQRMATSNSGASKTRASPNSPCSIRYPRL
jgi:hypothetical protein